jgi:hypothetical protein
MKNSRIFAAMIGIALLIGISALGARTAIAAGPPTVSLLTATSFAVLAGAGITNTGPTSINGDVGTYPTTTETGFSAGADTVTLTGINHAGDAVTQGAKTSLVTAYDNARLSGPTNPVVASLGGSPTPLPPGVYNSASSLQLTGALTLSGGPSDVWIFQAGSTLTTASGSSVVLIGGAQSCNIFWQIGSSATIGTGSAFKGTIIAKDSITVTTGASIDGRALARDGAVTLDTNTITISTCSAPTVSALPPCEFMVNIPNAPCAGTRPAPTTQAGATQTPSASTVAATAPPTPSTAAAATATPTGATATPTGATATPTGATATPTGATATPTVAFTPAPVIAGVQTLPSTSTDEQISPLLILAVALGGIGVLMLLRGPVRHL